MTAKTLSKYLNIVKKRDTDEVHSKFSYSTSYIEENPNFHWLYEIDSDFFNFQYHFSSGEEWYDFIMEGKLDYIRIVRSAYNGTELYTVPFDVPKNATEEIMFQLSTVYDIGIITIKHINKLNQIFNKFYIEDSDV